MKKFSKLVIFCKNLECMYEKFYKILLFYSLVPRSVSLLPAVVNGSASQVHQALVSIASSLSSVKTDTASKSSPDLASSSEDASTAKRMHLDSTECEKEDGLSENEDVDMIGDVSGKTDEEVKTESIASSKVKSQPDSNASPSIGTSLSMHVLLEHSVYNNNVLHLCGGAGEMNKGALGDDNDDKKAASNKFKPFCGKI